MSEKKYEINFNIVLIEPEIPANTGNIGRTCVATKSKLHLVGPLGFEINDKRLKRAGLDYWPFLEWSYYNSYSQWIKQVADMNRVFYFSTKAQRTYYQIQYQKQDWLVFGKETKGLDDALIKEHAAQAVTIPMPGENIRSLNLSNAAAVSLFEGLRQLSCN